MKHSIVTKTVALLLCAAALMGAVASGGAIFALTSTGLYNHSVEEVKQQRQNDYSQYFARSVALSYASRTLGGAPQALTRGQYTDGGFRSFFRDGAYGYALLDSSGNVLASENPDLKAAGNTLTFPVSGNYMHILETSAWEPDVPLITEQAFPGVDVLNGEYGIYDAVPPEGAEVYDISVSYTDLYDSGSSDVGGEGMSGANPIGVVYYNSDGELIFEARNLNVMDSYDERERVTSITLRGKGGEVLFAFNDPYSVGSFSMNSNIGICYIAGKPHQGTPAEPEYDLSQPTPVGTVSFLDADMEEFYRLHGDNNIGYAYTDGNGSLAFQSLPVGKGGLIVAQGAVNSGQDVYGIHFWDVDGNYIYDLYCADTPIGRVALYPTQEGQFTVQFQATDGTDIPAAGEETSVTEPTATTAETTAATEETASSTEETAAETTAQTTAETTAQTTEATVSTEETASPETTAALETVPPAQTTPATAVAQVLPEVTEPVMINGRPITEYERNRMTYYASGQRMEAEYIYLPLPDYTVEVYFTDAPSNYEEAYDLLTLVRDHRSEWFLVLGICLLVFGLLVVYLCITAGRIKGSDEVKAGGLNRMPLDLYFVISMTVIVCLAALCVEGGDFLLRQGLMLALFCFTAAAYVSCLLVVGFGYAAVAQCKTPGGFWYRNTLCGWCLRWLLKTTVKLKDWSMATFFPWAWVLTKKLCKLIWACILRCWDLTKQLWNFCIATLKACFAWLGRTVKRFMALLPMTWQWILTGFAIVVVLLIAVAGRLEGLMGIWLCASLAIVLYGSHCFGVLMESTKRMGKGDLDTKVDDKLMVGCFQEFAGDLNNLADVAVVAAQKQLKSERMKTELITNVSHDIKTPLTSIINYVDLLQKPHSDEEQEMYLEVLSRQSQQLKKLIDDLMEMSKASTGNMAVDITEVDAVESVNQALGEFADKLDKAQLLPVFRHTEESVKMMADGRLVWRVLGNLLSNAVKYAMPGTRLYIDLTELEGKVVISLKNISRDELNVDADELMERFVRGDDSRNTEGSGLGLNIAKSLMELQKGQLQLLVDGDLFKVTLIFPGC